MEPTPNDINVTTLYLLMGRLEAKMDGGFAGVHGRLDKLNGKVSSHEVAIAILKDRSDQAEEKADAAESSAATAKTRSWFVSTGMAGLITGTVELLKLVWGKP